MTILSGFGHVRLAVRKELGLPRNLSETPNDLLVATVKVPDGIGNSHVFAEFDDQLLGPAEIVAGNAGVKVVDCLLTTV